MPRFPHFLRVPSKLQRKARRSRIATMLILLGVICVFIAPFYIIYKPPNLLIRYFQHRWPDVLFRVSTSSKVIALTIDDGPSEFTEEIMQLLKANGATATFFVIGSQVPGREETLKHLVLNGNELGNHAMHDEPSRSLSDSTLITQIQKVDDMMHNAYAAASHPAPPKYFRPGSGFFRARMRKIVSSLEYRLVLGGIYPHDPQIPYWSVNARHILSMLRPGGIIICHDRRSWTVPMLRKVLPEMKRRGYRIVTVTELLKEGQI
jgi:peptidoglycan/xylan/chitin deacetylase (PgdA/CDA1 family)